MKCAWQSLIHILPPWMRADVDRQGREALQELRIRRNRVPQLILNTGIRELSRTATDSDIAFILNAASAYSPWTSDTMAQGFLTAGGGHRIGIGGLTVVKSGQMTGFRHPNSLCIRVARDFPGIAASLSMLSGSVLILGPPGSGKTTLLRDLIRQWSATQKKIITVVDERGELFPCNGMENCFDPGPNTDVLTGCSKSQGIEAALRNMGPAVIAVDEITAEDDCRALQHAGWCGVDLIATAHAGSIKDLYSRPVYNTLANSHLFSTAVIMRSDKTWKTERMNL